MEPIAIAIDGPAASGKSTVGAQVAARLGYLYFDTGVMYRAVTLAALSREIAIEDEDAVTTLAKELDIQVLRATLEDGRQYTVLVEGKDVTWELRQADVNRFVSPVSAYPGVRAALTAKQREIGSRGDVVMVGRDIGTVVLPGARIKVYLDASLEERARRRHLETRHRGGHSEMQEILEDLRRRDAIDSTRAAAPLRPADDAVILDSTNYTADQVVTRILDMVACLGAKGDSALAKSTP